MHIKIPVSRNSENYECSDISYSNSFSLILTSSYLFIAGVEVLLLHPVTLNDTHPHTLGTAPSGRAIS